MSQKNETRNMRDTIQRFQSYIALVVIFIIGSHSIAHGHTGIYGCLYAHLFLCHRCHGKKTGKNYQRNFSHNDIS